MTLLREACRPMGRTSCCARSINHIRTRYPVLRRVTPRRRTNERSRSRWNSRWPSIRKRCPQEWRGEASGGQYADQLPLPLVRRHCLGRKLACDRECLAVVAAAVFRRHLSTRRGHRDRRRSPVPRIPTPARLRREGQACRDESPSNGRRPRARPGRLPVSRCRHRRSDLLHDAVVARRDRVDDRSPNATASRCDRADLRNAWSRDAGVGCCSRDGISWHSGPRVAFDGGLQLGTANMDPKTHRRRHQRLEPHRFSVGDLRGSRHRCVAAAGTSA